MKFKKTSKIFLFVCLNLEVFNFAGTVNSLGSQGSLCVCVYKYLKATSQKFLAGLHNKGSVKDIPKLQIKLFYFMHLNYLISFIKLKAGMKTCKP